MRRVECGIGVQSRDGPELRVGIPEWTRRIEPERQPDIGAERLRGDARFRRQREPRLHHSDDRQGLLVRIDGRADDVGRAAEAVPPEAMGQHGHRRATGIVVILADQAAHGRSGTEHPEGARRHGGDAHPLRAFRAHEVRAASAIGAQGVQGACVVPEEPPGTLGDVPLLIRAHAGDGALEPQQSIRLGIGQRIQHDPLERRVDGRAGADAQGEGDHGDDRESRVFEQPAKRVSQVIHRAEPPWDRFGRRAGPANTPPSARPEIA